MYDKALIVEHLENIEASLQEVLEWTKHVCSSNDFTTSQERVILLNAVCMKLFAVGEEVKNIDKRTGKTLLPKYQSIPWKDVMGMRDVIAHHYFKIDADEVLRIIRDDILPLLTTVAQIKVDLQKI